MRDTQHYPDDLICTSNPEAQKGGIPTPAMPTRGSPPASGRKGNKPASLVSDAPTPCNKAWNWFCCLAFWSNYSELAKCTHLHGPRGTWTSIYMASEQSIHFNRIILRTFPIQGITEFPPTLWLAALPQEAKAFRNEPCGCLMSKPGFPSWKRSRSTDLPFLCILLQQRREKKKKKAATLGSAWRGGVLNITVRRAERRTAGALGTPWEKGFPGVGLHFESPHHKMIKHKGKKKALPAWWTTVSYSGSAITSLSAI